jgi:hypothetical protein
VVASPSSLGDIDHVLSAVGSETSGVELLLVSDADHAASLAQVTARPWTLGALAELEDVGSHHQDLNDG